MRRHPTNSALAGLLFGVVAVFLAGPLQASDDSLAVLGVESIEVGDALANQVTDALRHRAAELPGIRLVPGKDFIELKMVFGCDGEAPACMAHAGRTLGADRLVYGSLKKADGGKSVIVSLKLLDVRELAIVKQVTETVPRKSLTAATLGVTATRWLGQLIVPPQLGSIAVQSQPPDAQVALDGTPVGHTPLKLKEIRPGTHTVGLQLDGHQSANQTIEVHAGAMETVVVKLEREARVEPVKPPRTGLLDKDPNPTLTQEPPKPRHPGRGGKIAGIALVAGAVIAGSVAIYTWRSYLDLENSASARLRELAPPAGTNAQRTWFADPKCERPPDVPDSQLSRTYVENCQSGKKYTDATTGLWISAGVLATAGIVSLIVGDRLDAKAARERRQGGPSIKQSLRLLPAVSTQGGGLSASFEF